MLVEEIDFNKGPFLTRVKVPIPKNFIKVLNLKFHKSSITKHFTKVSNLNSSERSGVGQLLQRVKAVTILCRAVVAARVASSRFGVF